jgi:hypothetical protein
MPPSNAANTVVCLDCHCRAATGPKDDRIERQAQLARAIRSAAAQAKGERKLMLVDRALLIELATSVDEVLVLLEEVEALGMEIERRAA